MRVHRLLLSAVAVASVAWSTPAFAQRSWGTEAYGTNADGKAENRLGFFEGNAQLYGVPDQNNKIGPFPRVGGKLEGSVFRAQGTAGPCSGSVGVGNVEAYAELGLGIDTTGPAGGSTYRTPGGRMNMPRPSGRFSPPMQNGSFNGGGRDLNVRGRTLPGVVQCKAGVEVSAISLQGQCDTPVGTIAGNVKGVGAQAECGCNGCFAEAYWAKAGVDYTTPAVGGCGLKASVTAGAEVMAGVAAGAGRTGTVGGNVKLGPVGVKLGLNIEEFDTGKMAECVTQAAEAIYDAGKQAVQTVRNVASSIRSGIASGAKKAGCFFSGLFGGGCKDDSDKNGGGNSSAGGTTVSGGSYDTPGIAVLLGDYTTATAATVNVGLSTGRLPGVDSGSSSDAAVGAGMARE